MISQYMIGILQILLGTTCFGISWVIARAAMDMNIGPFTFSALQHVVATLVLYIMNKYSKDNINTSYSSIDQNISIEQVEIHDENNDNYILKYKNKEEEDESKDLKNVYITPNNNNNSTTFNTLLNKYSWLELLCWGLLCGFINFIGTSCTQVGLVSVDAGKSAFITGLYVIFTPIIQFMFPCLASVNFKGISRQTWFAAILSVVGTYFLSGLADTLFTTHYQPEEEDNLINSSTSSDDLYHNVVFGEFITFLGAILWAFSIIFSDIASKRVDCMELSMVEMFCACIICIIAAIILEPDNMYDVIFHFNSKFILWLCIIMVGLLDSLGYLFDTLGQMVISASKAAILMSLDSIITVIVGYLYLNELLTWFEFLGCGIIFIASLISSLDNEIE